MRPAVSLQGDSFRWFLLAVLSCITIINYVDRQALSILYPAITHELHLPEQTYTLLVTLFLIPYTAMYSVGGWLVDVLGVCDGLALALAWWSAATMLTGTSHDVFWLEVFRVMLALGQPIVSLRRSEGLRGILSSATTSACNGDILRGEWHRCACRRASTG